MGWNFEMTHLQFNILSQYFSVHSSSAPFTHTHNFCVLFGLVPNINWSLMHRVGGRLGRDGTVAHVMCASVWKNRHTWVCVLTVHFWLALCVVIQQLQISVMYERRIFFISIFHIVFQLKHRNNSKKASVYLRSKTAQDGSCFLCII